MDTLSRWLGKASWINALKIVWPRQSISKRRYFTHGKHCFTATKTTRRTLNFLPGLYRQREVPPEETRSPCCAEERSEQGKRRSTSPTGYVVWGPQSPVRVPRHRWILPRWDFGRGRRAGLLSAHAHVELPCERTLLPAPDPGRPIPSVLDSTDRKSTQGSCDDPEPPLSAFKPS